MGKLRFTNVVQNIIDSRRDENDLLIQNAIRAVELLEKPGGWSNAFSQKNSLPGVISRGAYQPDEVHCCFAGIYDAPATIANIAGNRKWEVRNADINYKRWDGVGYVDFAEAFVVPNIEALGDTLKYLFFDIFDEFQDFNIFAGSNLKFYISAGYPDKATLLSAMELVITDWASLTKPGVQDFYSTVLGLSQGAWDPTNSNLRDYIKFNLCGGNEDNLIFNTLTPPAP